jgi:hypothetical protein
VNADLVGFVQNNRAEQTATLVETEKASALGCYEGYVAYRSINTWWAEQGLVVHTEFRDGNVPAGFEQRRVLEEALKSVPRGVSKVRLRSDTAGYCDEEKNKWCGRIEFAVGCDVTSEFKKAVLELPKRIGWY